MIYQMADTALNPKLRIREIIGRPAQMYLGLRGKQAGGRIRELLALIELEPDDYIDRLPSELSGGQKQRIGIARALAAEPVHHLRRGDIGARPVRGRGHPEAARSGCNRSSISPTCSSPTIWPR